MNKNLQRGFSLMLSLSLLTCLNLPVLAKEEKAPETEETEETVPQKQELTISSMKDFLAFRENCIRDVYSRDLTVSLKTDLDFTGLPFESIPSFSGTFLGNKHTISGIHFTLEGSDQGLFRYLTDTALIRDLHVEGDFQPEGSRSQIGGIAGVNAGRIQNCTFQGHMAGNESVGGIVGKNLTSGIVESCSASGSIRGSHFIGGIVGENLGVIRKCKNLASVNVREEDNQIDSVSLDPEFLMGKESVETATDLGGITGTNSGVIRDSINHGNVGYPKMGYNLGGIAGSQKGYIASCKNYGTIQGRKEIAGIAGQLEPVMEVSFQEDTLQILRRQLNHTSNLANRAANNVQVTSQQLRYDIEDLRGSAEDASDAIHNLLPGIGEFPDFDTIIASKNALSSSLGAMHGAMGSINNSAQAMVGTAAADIRAVNNSIKEIGETLDHAGEHLGGNLIDISDLDTPEDLTGKIENCHNAGLISADLNAGGIAGAVAWENDLDPEDDFTVTGEQSLNFDSRLRAVILNSSNAGKIQVSKRNGGGIAGNLSLGLVKNCSNTGFIEGEKADYLGGIAGTSLGFIRNSYVKCKLQGRSFLGGIAGSASIVSDCRSTVLMEENGERLGSMVGFAEEDRTDSEQPIRGNYYLPLEDHLGAIDGVDYFEAADSLNREDFLNLPDLPQMFRNASMTFIYPDGSTQKVVVPLGDVVPESKIPAPPRKEGYLGKWDGLQDLDLNHMFFDVTLEAQYDPATRVLESDLLRWDQKPVMLAEGSFQDQEQFSLVPCEDLPQDHASAEGWLLPEFSQDADTRIHITAPQDADAEDCRVLVKGADGNWETREAQPDGSYLILSVKPTDQAVAVYVSQGRQIRMILSIGGTLAAAGILTAVFLRIRKKKAAQKAKDDSPNA